MIQLGGNVKIDNMCIFLNLFSWRLLINALMTALIHPIVLENLNSKLVSKCINLD